MLELDVCAAVIKHSSRFLLATRPDHTDLAGHWEFPGGKQEPSETLEECIIRELKEELHLTVTSPTYLTTVTHSYPDKFIRLHFMLCHVDETCRPVCRENQEAAWYTAEELFSCNLAPADRRFIESFDLSAL